MADAEGIEGGMLASLAKVAQGGARTWEREELLDVLHWTRQCVGVALGLAWGAVPLEGLLAFAAYVAASSAAVLALYGGHLKLDADDFGGHNALLTEGFAPATALFVVAWSVVYTSVHAA